MVTMLKQVLTLIARVDNILYQSIRAALLAGGSPLTEEEAIAVHLVPLLHPFVQRLFVGMCLYVCRVMCVCVCVCTWCMVIARFQI